MFMGEHTNRSRKLLSQNENTGGFKDIRKGKWHQKLGVYQRPNEWKHNGIKFRCPGAPYLSLSGCPGCVEGSGSTWTAPRWEHTWVCGCWSSIWCPVPWPCCVTVAANKLGFGLNVFETTPSLTRSNCLNQTDSWKTGLLTEWPKCHWNRKNQSFSVFYRHTDCKLKKGQFGKASPLRDRLMCNYLMQSETPRSSSPAKRHQNRRQIQWLVQSFLWRFRCKNSNPGRLYSHTLGLP